MQNNRLRECMLSALIEWDTMYKLQLCSEILCVWYNNRVRYCLFPNKRVRVPGTDLSIQQRRGGCVYETFSGNIEIERERGEFMVKEPFMKVFSFATPVEKMSNWQIVLFLIFFHKKFPFYWPLKLAATTSRTLPSTNRKARKWFYSNKSQFWRFIVTSCVSCMYFILGYPNKTEWARGRKNGV